MTHLGKKKGKKQDGSTASNTMDKFITYRIQRIISELNTFIDLLEEMMFFVTLSISLNTFAAGIEALLWIRLFLCFQRWNTTAWEASFRSRRFVLDWAARIQDKSSSQSAIFRWELLHLLKTKNKLRSYTGMKWADGPWFQALRYRRGT